jgi:hypothetical protein
MMNIDTIENSYYLDDKRRIALEAERMAYIWGDIELAKAYGMIADLLHDKMEGEDQWPMPC